MSAKKYKPAVLQNESHPYLHAVDIALLHFMSYQNGNNQPTKRSGGKVGGQRKDLNSSDEEWYPSQSW